MPNSEIWEVVQISLTPRPWFTTSTTLRDPGAWLALPGPLKGWEGAYAAEGQLHGVVSNSAFTGEGALLSAVSAGSCGP